MQRALEEKDIVEQQPFGVSFATCPFVGGIDPMLMVILQLMLEGNSLVVMNTSSQTIPGMDVLGSIKDTRLLMARTLETSIQEAVQGEGGRLHIS